MLVGEAINPNAIKGSMISVSKTKLETTLKENRTKHTQEYHEAVKDHRKALIAYFEKQLVLAKEGKDCDRVVPFEEPTSHEDDYDRVIKMLEFCTKDEVFISEQEFQHFVMDDWDWKQNFAHNAAVYKTSIPGR